ncbi:MAG: hypothetical protein KAR20_23840 [Candidatus Heimdallarchaeota archaeon]|nr:hypothetical protein [Candidatus Heimdallarchaeota archaeon]
MADQISIECPVCHEFSSLKFESGTYNGRCTNCRPGVRFSVVIIKGITRKDEAESIKEYKEMDE